MNGIDPQLSAKLASKLRVSARHVNRLIDAIVKEKHLTRQQAALVLASRSGVSFSRYADPDDLAAIRTAGNGVSSPGSVATPPYRDATSARISRGHPKSKKAPGNSVFVVHGRNERVRRDLFQFLRDLGLNPIEWTVGKQLTRKGAPHNAEVLSAIIKKAAGAVVLFCPEEEARLKDEYWRDDDPAEERQMTEQPRPNVLYEAGMAFAAFPSSTVIVRVGRIRHFTDLAGIQIVNLTNGTATGRQDVASALKSAKLPVDTRGNDWLREGGFVLDAAAEATGRRVVAPAKGASRKRKR